MRSHMERVRTTKARPPHTTGEEVAGPIGLSGTACEAGARGARGSVARAEKPRGSTFRAEVDADPCKSDSSWSLLLRVVTSTDSQFYESVPGPL